MNDTPKNKRLPGRPKRKEDDSPIDQMILRIASKLFMDYGYEAVSLQQISKTCGVTKASIYYYFENKSQLFTASITTTMAQARIHTQRIMEQSVPLMDRLRQLAEVKLANPHGEFETIMREARPSLSQEQLQEILSSEEAIHDVLIESFQQSMDTGEIRTGNTLFLAHTFSSLLMLGNREATEDYNHSYANLAQEIIDFFWNGVAPKG
jgi:TetR/AcrR family transcriptional repressor of mexJK operon